MDDRPDGGE
jgi:hypothetical protein